MNFCHFSICSSIILMWFSSTNPGNALSFALRCLKSNFKSFSAVLGFGILSFSSGVHRRLSLKLLHGLMGFFHIVQMLEQLLFSFLRFPEQGLNIYVQSNDFIKLPEQLRCALIVCLNLHISEN